jgi:Cof subfamily protein (haloacid dehalogenase superfamily)
MVTLYASAMTPRLVAIDLDGTLLNDAKKVTERTVAALACLPSRGVKVVLASARPPRSVRHVYRQLGLDTLQINYDGALIWDEPAGRIEHHTPLAGPLVRRLIAFARERFPRVIVSSEIVDRWYTDRDDMTHTTETGRLFPPDVIAALHTFDSIDTTKVMFLADPGVIASLSSSLAAKFAPSVRFVRTDANLLQLIHPDAGKGAALRRVAGIYGVPAGQVLAIGDADNDVDMIRWAGTGVAMDNAAPHVKAAADWVAPCNNDHGVHAALVRFGLCD